MSMSYITSDKREGLSQLDYTYDLLSSLTDDELQAVQQVAIVFINRKNINANAGTIAPFQPQTEEQLLARIDHSLEQVEAGLCEDLDDVYTEMMSGIES